MIMAAITNSFLYAYDARDLLVTINGECLETKNRTYKDKLVFVDFVELSGCISGGQKCSLLLTAPRRRFLDSMVIRATMITAQAVSTTADQVSI